MGRLVILRSRLFPLFSERPRLCWRGPLEQYDGARGREVNQLAPRRSTHSLPLGKEAISRHLSKQPRWFCRICCSSGLEDPKSTKYLWFGGAGAFLAVCAIVATIVVVMRKRSKRELGESLADLPAALVEENKRANTQNVP